jgi:hypothetical protein
MDQPISPVVASSEPSWEKATAAQRLLAFRWVFWRFQSGCLLLVNLFRGLDGRLQSAESPRSPSDRFLGSLDASLASAQRSLGGRLFVRRFLGGAVVCSLVLSGSLLALSVEKACPPCLRRVAAFFLASASFRPLGSDLGLDRRFFFASLPPPLLAASRAAFLRILAVGGSRVLGRLQSSLSFLQLLRGGRRGLSGGGHRLLSLANARSLPMRLEGCGRQEESRRHGEDNGGQGFLNRSRQAANAENK